MTQETGKSAATQPGRRPGAKAGGRSRVVLVGLGHAHLAVVSAAKRFRERGIDLVLIDPGAFWYSGLGSAMLAGRYGAAADTVDARRLAEATGTIFISEQAAGIDREKRIILTQSGQEVAYDVASFNVGSRVAGDWPLDDRHVWAVKPVSRLLGVRQALLAAEGSQRVVVIGGGVTGAELTGNLLALGRRHAIGIDVTLVAGRALLAGAPSGVAERVRANLTTRGARIVEGARYASTNGQAVRLDNGAALPFDHLVFATGLKPEPLMERLGLPVTGGGELRVTQDLHSVSDACIFAAGDCAAIEGHERPKVGVFGVRAGPYLLHNLLAAAEGRFLKRYRPQEKWLAILDLGDGTAIAMRGRRWLHSHASLRLKDWIDRRFVRQYQALYDGR